MMVWDHKNGTSWVKNENGLQRGILCLSASRAITDGDGKPPTYVHNSDLYQPLGCRFSSKYCALHPKSTANKASIIN